MFFNYVDAIITYSFDVRSIQDTLKKLKLHDFLSIVVIPKDKFNELLKNMWEGSLDRGTDDAELSEIEEEKEPLPDKLKDFHSHSSTLLKKNTLIKNFEETQSHTVGEQLKKLEDVLGETENEFISESDILNSKLNLYEFPSATALNDDLVKLQNHFCSLCLTLQNNLLKSTTSVLTKKQEVIFEEKDTEEHEASKYLGEENSEIRLSQSKQQDELEDKIKNFLDFCWRHPSGINAFVSYMQARGRRAISTKHILEDEREYNSFIEFMDKCVQI